MGGTVTPNYTEPWSVNSAIKLPTQATQLYSGGSVNPGDYTNMNTTDYSAFDTDQIGANSMFDMPGMDIAKMGIGGINSIAGLIGAFDTMKTNKIARAGMEQNQRHAKMARDDRTAFLGDTKSAFQ